MADPQFESFSVTLKTNFEEAMTAEMAQSYSHVIYYSKQLKSNFSFEILWRILMFIYIMFLKKNIDFLISMVL